MNKWVRRILIVLEVGGGFTGLSITLSSLMRYASMAAYAVVGFGMFAGLFLLGVLSGLMLVDRPRVGIVLSGVYQAFQIPILSCSWITYKFFSGIQIGIGLREGRPGWVFGCGARSILGTMQEQPSEVGVNVLALGLFLYLLLPPQPRKEAH